MSESKLNIHFLGKIFLNFLKFLMPFLALFFGFVIWIEGVKFSFKDSPSRISVFECFYSGLWIITLCLLFKKFFSIDFKSILLSIFFTVAISIEFWVLLRYNHFTDACLAMVYTYSPLDVFIITFASIFPTLEALILYVSIVNTRFQSKLAHLTNITKIRDDNTSKFTKIFEIWTSFPIFMGFYHIFLLLHEFFVLKWCYYLQTYIMLLIALPWIILMIFYVIYNTVMTLKGKK